MIHPNPLCSLLTNVNLPEGEAEFFETLNIYFPKIYDIKYLMKSCKNLKGGLQVRTTSTILTGQLSHGV
jgi:hypothetical protein